jgi:phospholipid transport system substrate-binding protein
MMNLRALGLSVCVLCLGVSSAHASAASEAYVATNAKNALQSLAAQGSADARSAKFGALMDQFANVPALADFVLGKYARTVRADPALHREWVAAYRNYAMAAYEDSFDRYRGAAIKVTGSRDYTQNGKSCSRVASDVTKEGATPLSINWYVCAAGGAWKVTDVGLVSEGSELKLAITQRDQMVAFLGSNGGDVRKLIAKVNAQAAAMKKPG